MAPVPVLCGSREAQSVPLEACHGKETSSEAEVGVEMAAKGTTLHNFAGVEIVACTLTLSNKTEESA